MSNRLVSLVLGICLVASASVFAADGESFARNFGGIQAIALLDVRGSGNPELLIGITPENLAQYNKPGAMDNSINAFVARMNGKTYLFDTGLGKGGARKGAVLESLAAAGLSPDSIDAVIITHFHGDHVGGLTQDGKAVFPKADLYVAGEEVEKWDPAGLGFLKVYGDKVKKFDIGSEVVPGVKSIDARGHTPGHTAFMLEAGGGKLFIVGDVIHFAGIQLPLPGVAVRYDTDPVAAVAARKRVFDMAVAEKVPVAAMHLAFPGIGTLDKAGEGYSFTSVK